jgi:hypothetical protein
VRKAQKAQFMKYDGEVGAPQKSVGLPGGRSGSGHQGWLCSKMAVLVAEVLKELAKGEGGDQEGGVYCCGKSFTYHIVSYLFHKTDMYQSEKSCTSS